MSTHKHWYSIAMERDYGNEEISMSAQRYIIGKRRFHLGLDPYLAISITLGLGVLSASLVVALELKAYLFSNPAALSLWLVSVTLSLVVILHGLARHNSGVQERIDYLTALERYDRQYAEYRESLEYQHESHNLQLQGTRRRHRLDSYNEAPSTSSDSGAWRD